MPGILRTIGKMIGKDSIYFSMKPYQLNKVAFVQLQAAIIIFPMVTQG